MINNHAGYHVLNLSYLFVVVIFLLSWSLYLFAILLSQLIPILVRPVFFSEYKEVNYWAFIVHLPLGELDIAVWSLG